MIGYKSFECFGNIWQLRQRAIMPLFTLTTPLQNVRKSAESVIRENDAWLLRWDDGFDEYESSDWWHVIKDKEENISELSQNTRSKIRRGDKAFYCEMCDAEVILAEGFDVYRAAYDRYRTHEQIFERNEFVDAVRGLTPQTEFWAVRDRVNGMLVAFSENIRSGNACLYNTIWFQPEALKKYVSYILFHKMNTHYLNVMKLSFVSDGTRSISHETNIHEFLQSKFLFRKAYARLHVIYVPWLSVSIRILYPLRFLFDVIPMALFKKVSILLEQERIRRLCSTMPESNR